MPFVIHEFGINLRWISSSTGENVGKYFFHLLLMEIKLQSYVGKEIWWYFLEFKMHRYFDLIIPLFGINSIEKKTFQDVNKCVQGCLMKLCLQWQRTAEWSIKLSQAFTCILLSYSKEWVSAVLTDPKGCPC